MMNLKECLIKGKKWKIDLEAKRLITEDGEIRILNDDEVEWFTKSVEN